MNHVASLTCCLVVLLAAWHLTPLYAARLLLQLQ
jgi:hypothetical protein